MNRGSVRPSRRPGKRYCSFNEAPIHESGKFCFGMRATGKRCGFNEAPIHESGKCQASCPG